MRIEKKIILIAFIEGFSVLSLEILSKNILAPFFGNSLTIWSIAIGNTFLFLSLGYLLSSFLLNKNKLKLIQYFLILLAILISSLPFLSNLFIGFFISKTLYLGALCYHLALFAPIFLLFGMLNPLLIEYLKEKNESQNYGLLSGKIFLISTFGGLLTCFLIFYMFFSKFEIYFIIIGVSLLIYLLVLVFFRNKINFFFSLIYFVLFFYSYSLIQKQYKSEAKVKLKYHSNDLFGDLKVFDKFDTKSGKFYRYLNVNNIPQAIAENNHEMNSTWNYVHRISLISSLKMDKNGLLIGMGGGTIASELQRLFIKLDIVDIDQRMFDVAQEYFYFKKNNSQFFVDDARYFLNKSKKKYDLIVFDVLNGESQPSNLFTKEGVAKMKENLTEDGFLIIEFQEILDKESKAYKSICNTLLDSELSVYTSISYDEIADILIIAGKNPIDFSMLNPSKFTSNVKSQTWLFDYLTKPFTKINEPFKDCFVLTDDLPLLDKYAEKTKKKWRENIIKQNLFLSK